MAAKRRKKRSKQSNASRANKTPDKQVPTSQEALNASRQAIEIVKARHERGLTMRQIAEEQDCSVTTVHKWLHHAALTYKETYPEAWDELRVTTTQQLDQLIADNFSRALAGDKSAGAIVLRSLVERNRMHGMYPDGRPGAGGPPGGGGGSLFDGVTENERAQILVELLDRAGDDALELIGLAIARKRAAKGQVAD